MTIERLPIFPLSGAILLPGQQLPLHIFEPRYRDMINDALSGAKNIGMIQPQSFGGDMPLFRIGCIGHIQDVIPQKNGCCDIVLIGTSLFEVMHEHDTQTLYRQVRAQRVENADMTTLNHQERADFEHEARVFSAKHKFKINWALAAALSDADLINRAAMIAPFDTASKQALIEAQTLSHRCQIMIELMRFYASHLKVRRQFIEATLQ